MRLLSLIAVHPKRSVFQALRRHAGAKSTNIAIKNWDPCQASKTRSIHAAANPTLFALLLLPQVISVRAAAPGLAPPPPDLPRVESDPATTNVGGWQSQPFDPARLYPIGVWELVGGDENVSLLNRRVRTINADFPVGMHPHWNDPYERWRRVWTGWRAKFDGDHGDLAPVIDWLRPGWLGIQPRQLSERRPVVLYWAPHGKLDDARANNLDYFSAVNARAAGLDYLVAGFYEGCRRLDQLGVKVIKHDGAPTHDNRAQLMGAKALAQQHALNLFSNAAIGLDAVVMRPRGDVDERVGDEYWNSGQGCLMEGVPDPTNPTHSAWLSKPWPVVCTYSNAAPRVFVQAEWAKGKWPTAGTPQFDEVYGPQRWYFWCLALNEWNLRGYDRGWASKPDALPYVEAYAARVQQLFRQCPRSIVLLPKGLPELCGRWGIPVESFLPPAMRQLK